ncbi:recombinase family protein [Micrococcaceae bacterium Sec5.7]
MAQIIVCYARVSTKEQTMESQVDAVVATGAFKVFMEQASGATQVRPQWQECLRYLQPGNHLVVTELTRPGRSTEDLAGIITLLGERGIVFKSLTEPWLDNRSAHGQL